MQVPSSIAHIVHEKWRTIGQQTTSYSIGANLLSAGKSAGTTDTEAGQRIQRSKQLRQAETNSIYLQIRRLRAGDWRSVSCHSRSVHVATTSSLAAAAASIRRTDRVLTVASLQLLPCSALLHWT